MADPLITKKITDVQLFANNEGTILQIQSSQLGQTPIATMKEEIKADVVAQLLSEGGVSLGIVNIKGTVATLVDLNSISDPQVNDAYQVEDENLFYVWDGTTWVGGFKLMPEPIGVVEEGNTQAVSGGEVWDYTKGIITESINLFNKDTDFINGKTYNTSGGLDNAVQRASFELIKVLPSSHYTLVGGNTIGDASVRLCYFDSNRQLITYETAETTGQFPIKITTPSNCHYIGGVIGQSSDPIIRENLKNTFMICKLSSLDEPLPNYEPYGNKIKAENIEGFDNKVANNEFLNDKIDTILNVFEKSYVFENSSYIDINSELYTLDNIGDYFEIKVKADPNIQLFNEGLSLIGAKYMTNGNFGFYSASDIRLRDSAGSAGGWKAFNNPSDIYEFNTLKLLVNDDNEWELFINGVSAGKQERTGSFNVSNIGRSYASNYYFKGEIEYLKINIKKSDSEDFDLYNFTDLLKIPDSINTGVTEKLTVKDSETPNTGDAKMYYQFSPTMYNGREGFNIFAKIKGTNKYVRYTLYRTYDMTELIYLDYYRLMECSEYVFNGVSMTPLGTTVLVGVENEFTMLQQGKADHSGGVHGDEIFTIARFKADGELISISEDIPLTPCGSFEYQIVSNIHETANSSAPTVPISGHPIIAEHVKTVVVSSEGLDITNVVDFKQAIPLVRAYLGIVCMGKEFATSGSTENGDVTAINDKDGSMKISNNMANTVYFSGEKGGSIITSELVNVYIPILGNQEQKIYKDKLLTYVIDRTTDSKYYRIVGSRSESTVINVEIGEIWKMNCNVKFFGK